MRVRNFNELADTLKDFGYPESWVTQDLMGSIKASTTGFAVAGVMREKGEQFHVNFDFKLTGSHYELEKMSMCLLKQGYSPSKPVELGKSAPNEKWVLEKTTAGEILQAHYLRSELIASRGLSAEKTTTTGIDPKQGQEETITIKHYTMNRNSLEAFREEAKALKVPQNMIDAAEVLMEQNVPKIEVFGQVPADRGMMDVTIHIKQSGQSDFYYFNKFDVALSKAQPLAPDHKYMVISPDPTQKDKNLAKPFTSVVQAMDFFKDQKGNAELAAGKFTDKDLAFRDTLATMKDGKVDYVKKEFSQTFRSPVIQNSHYVDRGKGFSVEQAANMLQGRAVFRDDLVSRAGVQYKAWNTYQFNEPKDRYNNYTLKQYGEGYRFDLKKELANYEIKELGQIATAKQLISKMENGYAPVVTVMGKDGEAKPLRIEAVPRYGNINLSEPGGKPVKREDYQKEQVLSQDMGKDKGQAKTKQQGQGQEMSM